MATTASDVLAPAEPRRRLGAAEFVTPAVIIFLALVTAGCCVKAGVGYDGHGGLDFAIVALTLIWIACVSVQRRTLSRLLEATKGFALFGLLSIISALSTAAMALNGGPYIDASLSQADHLLFPWTRWVGFAFELRDHRQLLMGLCYAYVSLDWQPMLALAILACFGQNQALRRFVTAWALALLGCVLPFHWLPARAAYLYYGIDLASMRGIPVRVAWEAGGMLDDLRSGAMHTIGVSSIGGLVTFPSFHACAAVLLGWHSGNSGWRACRCWRLTSRCSCQRCRLVAITSSI